MIVSRRQLIRVAGIIVVLLELVDEVKVEVGGRVVDEEVVGAAICAQA